MYLGKHFDANRLLEGEGFRHLIRGQVRSCESTRLELDDMKLNLKVLQSKTDALESFVNVNKVCASKPVCSNVIVYFNLEKKKKKRISD